MEIDVAEGMSRAPYRRGDNHIKTGLKLTPDPGLWRGKNNTERAETIQFSFSLPLSLVIYQSLLYNGRLQLPNRCLVAGITPISFTMATSGKKVGGQCAKTGLEFTVAIKLTK